jgi:hypothetical protein
MANAGGYLGPSDRVTVSAPLNHPLTRALYHECYFIYSAAFQQNWCMVNRVAFLGRWRVRVDSASVDSDGHGARGRGRGQPRPRGDGDEPAGILNSPRGHHVVSNEKGGPLDRTPRKHSLNNPAVPQAQYIVRYA